MEVQTHHPTSKQRHVTGLGSEIRDSWGKKKGKGELFLCPQFKATDGRTVLTPFLASSEGGSWVIRVLGAEQRSAGICGVRAGAALGEPGDGMKLRGWERLQLQRQV